MLRRGRLRVADPRHLSREAALPIDGWTGTWPDSRDRRGSAIRRLRTSTKWSIIPVTADLKRGEMAGDIWLNQIGVYPPLAAKPVKPETPVKPVTPPVTAGGATTGGKPDAGTPPAAGTPDAGGATAVEIPAVPVKTDHEKELEDLGKVIVELAVFSLQMYLFVF